MKRTLRQIKEKIAKVVEQKRLDAGYSGSMGDNGARELEEQLNMFIVGIKTAVDAYVEHENLIVKFNDFEIEVPAEWHKYFIIEDKEYKEYLKLKEKYEKYTR
jgi:hypothetical protein